MASYSFNAKTHRSQDGVRAIPTTYNRQRFRSKLEARWAYFLDYLEVKWVYEPFTFTLPSGYYLPDFYLPGNNMFIEVKPASFYDEGENAREWHLAAELAQDRKRPVLIMCGTPKLVFHGSWDGKRMMVMLPDMFKDRGEEDFPTPLYNSALRMGSGFKKALKTHDSYMAAIYADRETFAPSFYE